MSERINPEQNDAIASLSPRLMGEVLYRMWSPDGPMGFPLKSPEEVARLHEALATVADTSDWCRRREFEKAGHFTRAVLGNEPPPTFIIDQKKVDEIMGDSSGKQGFADWCKRETDLRWNGWTGKYLPGLDTAIIYASDYDRGHIIAHESAHRKGIVLTRTMTEGFASLVEHLYSYPVPTRSDWMLPASTYGLGLFMVAALCDQYPDLFDKMATVAREPSKQSYADLVERLYEATGITSADFEEIFKIDNEDRYTEYPQVLRKMIPEEYFQQLGFPLWNLIPKIIEKLEAYEQATGHSMELKINNLRGGERVFSKGPTHPENRNKHTESAIAEKLSTDEVTARIRDLTRTMGATAQSMAVEFP